MDREVDFLKLDIEGAEQQVLVELEQAGKLKFIKEIAIEGHEADQMMDVNDISKIVDLLERNSFSVHVIEKNIMDMLPEQVSAWAKKMQPRLFDIRAVRG